MKSLGELFTEYGSDKDSSHHYGQYYETHLPKKINKLLEIGAWRGGSVKAFKEYYNGKGEIHTVNYIFGGEIISKKELTDIGITPLQGYQEDINFLKQIKDIYTVIIDDGSHHSDAQIISFKQLFVSNLESKGIYIIEDVYGHKEGAEGEYWRRQAVDTADDTIMGVVLKWLVYNSLESQYFTKQESDLISPLIDKITIYNDQIIFIKKK